MTHDEMLSLAVAYWLAVEGSSEREATAWATDLYELEYNEPETLWQLILTIHAKDQSPRIQEVLSAGPVENLLDKHGDRFIERVGMQARRPRFVRVLTYQENGSNPLGRSIGKQFRSVRKSCWPQTKTLADGRKYANRQRDH